MLSNLSLFGVPVNNESVQLLTRRKQGLTNFQHSLQYLPGRWPIISLMSSLNRSTPETRRKNKISLPRQLNTAFANLVRCTYSTVYYIHSRFGVQSLTLLLGVFSLWEYQVLKILSRHWMLLCTAPIKFKWRVGRKETHETTGWPFQ